VKEVQYKNESKQLDSAEDYTYPEYYDYYYDYPDYKEYGATDAVSPASSQQSTSQRTTSF